MKLENKTYDILKYLTVIVLPAIGALWAGLSKIWNLPYAAEVPATITVICTFLGAILCISTAEYNKEVDTGTVAELNIAENAQMMIDILNADAKGEKYEKV